MSFYVLAVDKFVLTCLFIHTPSQFYHAGNEKRIEVKQFYDFLNFDLTDRCLNSVSGM